MDAKRFLAGSLLWLGVLSSTAVATVGEGRAAAPQGQQDQLRTFLEAGEFAPAVELARQATDPNERDDMLAKVAETQAAAGRERLRCCRPRKSATTAPQKSPRRLGGHAARRKAAACSPISIRSSI